MGFKSLDDFDYIQLAIVEYKIEGRIGSNKTATFNSGAVIFYE
jgi:hypothetical protein